MLLMEKKEFMEEIELPEGAEAKIDHGIVFMKGPKGENSKPLANKRISIKVEGKKIVLAAKRTSKKEKQVLKTFAAHIKNMVKGVTEGYVYKMKICAGHFPMNVAVSGNMLVVKNFIGEKHPRKIRITEGADIKVSGSDITIEGVDKEKVAQMSATIEEKTKRVGYDRRVFQDGIYITSKGGKKIR